MSVVSRINERQKDLLFRKIWKFFDGEIEGRIIGIWGASFKPESESIIGSPAVKLIESLLANGATIKLFDPLANKNVRKHFEKEDKLNVCCSALGVLEDVDILAICTEWNEFKDESYLEQFQKLRYKAIFDGRNMFDPNLLSEHGLEYYAIGRGKFS